MKQNLEEKAEFQHLYQIHLLFEAKPEKPAADVIREALERTFGDIDTVSGNAALTSFAVKKYVAQFQDGALPPQVVIADVQEFRQDSIDSFSRTQLWNAADPEELLERCSYEIMLFDMMASVMEYKDRCDMMMDWMETALSLFPDCTAVWIKPAGKLFDAEAVRRHQIPREDRFVYFGVNVRLFHIQGSDDHVVDTLGLYAVGLPDVQLHFHGLDIQAVVNYAYQAASYLYDNDAPIKSGETIDGIEDGRLSQEIQWRCQYEDALIQPVRTVMDICPGEYAAGGRQ